MTLLRTVAVLTLLLSYAAAFWPPGSHQWPTITVTETTTGEMNPVDETSFQLCCGADNRIVTKFNPYTSLARCNCPHETIITTTATGR